MADDTTADAVAQTTDDAVDATATEVEKEAFLERLNRQGAKLQETEKRAKAAEKAAADARRQLEERENAGLPELEQLRKRAEALEQKATEAEQRAEKAEQQQVRTQRERLVIAAAKEFDDPADALRYPEFVNLDEIEDADQAERAIKRLAKARPRLLKDTEPSRPQIGRVLEGGKPKGGQNGGIELDAEAEMLAAQLKKFARS